MPFSFKNGFLSGQYTKKYSCRQIVTYRQVSGGIFYAIFSYFSDSLVAITEHKSEHRMTPKTLENKGTEKLPLF